MQLFTYRECNLHQFIRSQLEIKDSASKIIQDQGTLKYVPTLEVALVWHSSKSNEVDLNIMHFGKQDTEDDII